MEQWRRAWHAGRAVTIDETMIWWTGLSTAHLTYLPRKPTPLGFQMKTLCDSTSHILLNAEVCEGKDIDRTKPFAESLGVTSATTLRVAQPYWSKGMVLYADSWFGSLKTAAELLGRGMYSIMNVKVATRGYPKQRIRSLGTLQRGESHHYAVQVSINNAPRFVFASVHMDS